MVYTELCQILMSARQRHRRLALGAAVVLLAICGMGVMVASASLAVCAVVGSIGMLWLTDMGVFDGDLVAITMQYLYASPLNRVQLAMLDTMSSRNADDSHIDYAIQQSLRLYRSLNHTRLFR